VTGDAGLMLAEFLMRGAICVDVCKVSRHRYKTSLLLFVAGSSSESRDVWVQRNQNGSQTTSSWCLCLFVDL